jgi:hypothetical protein
LGPARIRFNRDGTGELRFLMVQGGMNCRFETRDGNPFVEFSWSGFSEREETCGRGSAALEGGNRLKGRLFFHLGDDSAFRAVRERRADRRVKGSKAAKSRLRSDTVSLDRRGERPPDDTMHTRRHDSVAA